MKDRSPAQDWWLASIGLVAHKPSNVCVSTGTCPIGMCSGRGVHYPGWCVCVSCALVHGELHVEMCWSMTIECGRASGTMVSMVCM